MPPLSELHDGLGESSVYIADSNTLRYLPQEAIAADRQVKLQSGEGSKSWLTLERILSRFLEADLTRGDTVVGVGGGVVCDITAFAASLYMRGCDLVLIPTTLLAMVDAALGGKTGINFGGYKNMVGSFYPAREVRICPETLGTLSEREYLSGLAEVIKSAMLGDADLLTTLEQERERVLRRDPGLLRDIVGACVEIKGAIVERDLRETGERAHLNLGHTFAHALESVEGLGIWSHGEAVAWGLARAMELGVLEERTDEGYARRVRAILDAYGYRTDPIPGAARAIQNAMRRDKKRRGADVRFVLQEQLGSTFVAGVAPEHLEQVLEPTST
jgi:3-dehydroquinate synthase